MVERTIGIIGAGKLGITLAQLALKAGYTVYISGSGSADDIRLTVDAIAPGAVASTNEEVVKNAETIILALPLSKFRRTPNELFTGKLVIDATNYWWEVDGPRNDILPSGQSSSEAVQEYFHDARVVKALSHMGYHHLHDEARPKEAKGRKAIAIAGNDEKDVAAVSSIIDDFGFDSVFIGPLAAGRKLEPGSPAFGANVSAKELRELLK